MCHIHLLFLHSVEYMTQHNMAVALKKELQPKNVI